MLIFIIFDIFFHEQSFSSAQTAFGKRLRYHLLCFWLLGNFLGGILTFFMRMIFISTWSGDKVCDNFEFDKTQNDWMRIVPKIKLIFLILEM
jgi:hypothetical protein